MCSTFPYLFLCQFFRAELSQILLKSVDLTSLFTSTGFSGLGVLPGVATGTGLKPKSGKSYITFNKADNTVGC